MNPEAKERLDLILTKNPESLTIDEIAFLQARRGYLKNIQLEEYASILNPSPKKEPEKEPKKETVKKHDTPKTN